MKKTTYLIFALLLMAFTFMVSPAKADGDLPCNGDDPTTTTCPITGDGTSLPINSGATYLIIAGLMIGIAAVRKNKEFSLYKL